MSNLNRRIYTSDIAITCDDDDLIQGLAKQLNLALLCTSVKPDDVWPQATPSDHCLQLPPSVGIGWMRHLVIRPGLEVIALDFSLKHPVIVRSTHAPTLIELGFWQAGYDVHYRSDIGEGVGQPGQAALSTIPMPYEAEVFYPANERVQGVRLSIDPVLLRAWLNSYQPPDDLQLFIDAPSQFVAHQRSIPSTLIEPLLQLRTTTWQGKMLHLYAESKAMEIVALYAHHLAQYPSLSEALMTQDDIERLHQAKEILLSRLDEPPSLLELAQTVHLNDHKLKAGFKAVFGTTVFGMLYDHRMALARELLEDRRYSIVEIALQVGYRSPSAFSAAFKRKYGITPRQVRL